MEVIPAIPSNVAAFVIASQQIDQTIPCSLDRSSNS